MRRKIGSLIILSLIVVGIVGCGKDDKKEAVKNVIKKPITEGLVQEKSLSNIYSANGILIPQDKVLHELDTQGTVKKILKKNGDYVKKGEIIVEFTDAVGEANYFSAKAEMGAAKASYDLEKLNLAKYKKLYKKQLVSEAEFLNNQNKFTEALGRYESSKAKFASAKIAYDKLVRKAEIDGYLGNLNLKEENIVEKNKEIFTIVNDQNMEIEIDFPGKWLSGLKEGDLAVIEVPDLGNKKFEGKVKNINPIANSVTKKFPVKIVVKNENGEIKDGMYTRVSISSGERKGLTVPQESVFTRDLLKYVYKIEDEKAKKVEVEIGATQVPYIEVISKELKANDKVVVEGIFNLSDNDAVEIVGN